MMRNRPLWPFALPKVLNLRDVEPGVSWVCAFNGSTNNTGRGVFTSAPYPNRSHYNSLWVETTQGPRSLADMGIVPYPDGYWSATNATVAGPLPKPTMPTIDVKVNVDLSAVDEVINRVEILSVEPGDLIVLKAPRYMGSQERDNIIRAWKANCPGNNVVVLDGGIDVKVVRNALDQ